MNEFIAGNQYIHNKIDDYGTYTYIDGNTFRKNKNIGAFTDCAGIVYHLKYENMIPRTNPKHEYPNPPLPHCKERIAFARGANIQLLASGIWYDIDNPRFDEIVRYRVKIEKTKDELLIERLELKIRNNERANADHKKEINELKNKH